jgi:hypothetical protein
MLDEMYRELCKQVSSGGNIEKNIAISKELLCWKTRIYVPEGSRQQVIQSAHNSKMTGHFGRERTLKMIIRNFYWTNRQHDIRKYCKECDICQRMTAPGHAKHGLPHPLELACKPWRYIGMD